VHNRPKNFLLRYLDMYPYNSFSIASHAAYGLVHLTPEKLRR
jgi:hypothetical protein